MAESSATTMGRSPRRSQAERSRATRERLIDAALSCLVTDGYAGTTISRVVETAGLSRGASIHYFTKNTLMEAAATQLVRRFYVSLGKLIGAIDASEDRLHELIKAGWQILMTTPETTALMELMVASRHEPELAAMLHKLWIMGDQTIRAAAEHYLEPSGAGESVGDLMILTQWLLRGMAEDLHINSSIARKDEFFERYLTLWTRVLAQHARARANVTVPPPKPKYWDLALNTQESRE